MERDLPPSGADDRLSDSANRSIKPDARFRLVRGDPKPDLAEARDMLELYKHAYGMPHVIFDLSVDEVTERRLARSIWAGVVKIALESNGTTMHRSVQHLVLGQLSGRDPNVTLDDRYLSADFLMEDGSYESRMRAADFAYTLALLIGGLPERISVSEYKNPDPEVHESKEPPAGKPLV